MPSFDRYLLSSGPVTYFRFHPRSNEAKVQEIKSHKSNDSLGNESKKARAKRYEMEYGSIVSVSFVNYWKWTFKLEVLTSKGKRILIQVGGTSYDIYRYDPTSTDWLTHLEADIKSFMEVKE